jgi:integrase
MKARPSLQRLVRQYLDHRRALGYQLLHYDGHLSNFARFAQREGPGEGLTSALAIKWATSVKAGRPHQAKRLSIIRTFSRFCAAYDPRIQVPPPGLLGPNGDRIPPHIFSRSQIQALILRARALGTHLSPFRAHTYEALLGLLASTGIRPGEARRLRLADFDARAQTLRIAAIKSSPERVLPLHPTTVRALLRYLKLRQQFCPFGDHVFVGPRGQALRPTGMAPVFREIVGNMPSNGARPRPRLQDLRHTFATRHIAAWARQSAPLAHRLLLLSRYLGHRSFHDTWWYVSSDPATLRQAADQFERFRHGRKTFEQ